MERGTFLQMDKATSAYQVVLRNLRECCLYTNLDSSLCISATGYSQEAHAYRGTISVYDFPDHRCTMLFERIPIPELFNKPIINVPKDDGQLDLFRDLKS